MPRGEIVIIQFDIAGHSKIDIAPRNLQEARRLLQKYISAFVAVQRDTEVSWAGNGGFCWFRITDAVDFNVAADAAVDILTMMPRINEILLRDRILVEPLTIRLSADATNVELDDDPSHFCGPGMNAFLKHERDVGMAHYLVMTKRIYENLQPDFKKRFDEWRHSPELETHLYVYDGIRIRNETLNRLKNQRSDAGEIPPDVVKITTFHGDKYSVLCSEAYRDVELQAPIPNVETGRFLPFRNAVANSAIELWTPNAMSAARRPNRNLENDEAVYMAIAEAPYEALTFVDHVAPLRGRDPGIRAGHDTNELAIHVGPERALRWCNEDVVYKGGEELRFFNASALGFIVYFGESTLLDYAAADSLTITSVTGGVEEPHGSAQKD